MNAWTTAGAPTIRGRQRWALERQVRLVAGAIVTIAVTASLWWEPAKYAGLLVGAGLTLAALTNSCVMGTMLSKLPFNRPTRPADISTSLARLTGAKP